MTRTCPRNPRQRVAAVPDRGQRAGETAAGGTGRERGQAVTATHPPLAAVSAATTAIAAPTPSASATNPASRAPSTYPKSRQKR